MISKDDTPERRSTAAQMRLEFDGAFARPARASREEVEELVSVRVADEPCAVRTRDLVGIVPAPTVVRVPSREPALLGLAGVRGALVPVLSLATLLGHAARRERVGWLLLAGSDAEPLALGVSRIDGSVRVEASSVRAANEGARPFRREVARASEGLLWLIDVRAVIDAWGQEAPQGQGVR